MLRSGARVNDRAAQGAVRSPAGRSGIPGEEEP